jgi:SAM-dependent methyltransferase
MLFEAEMSTDKIGDIQEFWTRSPETYADDAHGGTQFDGKTVEFGTREFFENVDRKFIDERPHMHSDRPFGAIFPYDRYTSGRVLEIGCGMGTMAMQWAKHGSSYTGVDLSPMSIKMSARRFELFGYDGTFVLSDARHLPFADEMFDFGYSWGVLHHSPDLAQSLREMMRVIRKGGEFEIMLYNRNSLLYRYFIQYRQGFLNREAQFLGPLELASRYTDDFAREGNPHTWPVTKREVGAILAGRVSNLRFWIHGLDVRSHLAFLVPVLGSRLPAWAIKPWWRRFGWSLCFSGVRS